MTLDALPGAHRCQQCGASCQGLRVRVDEEERAQLVPRAEELGLVRVFSGPFLAQNWGRCVFWDQGCRLHRAFGPLAKPRACRQFPALGGGDVDPACFHPGPVRPQTLDVDWSDLSPGLAMARWLEALPLLAVLEGPLLGPLTCAALHPLVGVRPSVVAPETRGELGARIDVLVRHGSIPHPEPVQALLGGAQLLATAGHSAAGLAAWVRLLKVGLW